MMTFLIFEGLQDGLWTFLLSQFILMAMVLLVRAVYELSKGEKEAAMKAVRWLVVTVVGLVLLNIF